MTALEMSIVMWFRRARTGDDHSARARRPVHPLVQEHPRSTRRWLVLVVADIITSRFNKGMIFQRNEQVSVRTTSYTPPLKPIKIQLGEKYHKQFLN